MVIAIFEKGELIPAGYVALGGQDIFIKTPIYIYNKGAPVSNTEMSAF